MNLLNTIKSNIQFYYDNAMNYSTESTKLDEKVDSQAETILQNSKEIDPILKLTPQNTCNIEELKRCAAVVGGDTLQLVQTLEKTGNLTCEHFLSWKDQYYQGGTGYIDGIKPEDLDQSVKWGIDPCNRVFVGLRYTVESEDSVEKASVEAAAVFQRYTKKNILVLGNNHYGHSFSQFPRGDVNDSLRNLTTLFSRGSIDYQTFGGYNKTMKLSDPKL